MTTNMIKSHQREREDFFQMRKKAMEGTPLVYIKSNKCANMKLLQREVMKGLNPKWYAVIHFNDAANSKRQQRRRLDMDAVEQDLEVVKDQLYSELYGRKWKKKSNRARSSWSIEYGKSQIKPHFNLVIEELPFPYDSYRSAHVLFNTVLPLRCKCLWRNSADIQPIDYDESFAVNRYCSKESNKTNSTINYQLTDF